MVNGTCVFHWKDVHKEGKEKQGKKNSVLFTDFYNNTMIYFSYLISTSEDSVDGLQESGDYIQYIYFISLVRVELFE